MYHPERYQKRQNHRELIITFLLERAKKGRFIKTAEIAEAVGLNNHQVGDVMGRIKSDHIPGIKKIAKWSPHHRWTKTGATWEVELV